MRSDSLNANGATNNKEKNCCSYFLGGLILIACVAVIGLVVNNVHPPLATKLEGEEKFDKLGRYLMKDFDTRKPMSDFLNGLGGVWGIPMVRSRWT